MSVSIGAPRMSQSACSSAPTLSSICEPCVALVIRAALNLAGSAMTNPAFLNSAQVQCEDDSLIPLSASASSGLDAYRAPSRGMRPRVFAHQIGLQLCGAHLPRRNARILDAVLGEIGEALEQEH